MCPLPSQKDEVPSTPNLMELSNTTEEKEKLLAIAVQICRDHGERLTNQRRKILKLAMEQTSPLIKAYTLLGKMQEHDKTVAPPTVYRALNFFVSVGLMHKIEALNAYLICTHLHCQHQSLILVCEKCEFVKEISAEDSVSNIDKSCSKHGFSASRQDFLIIGTCKKCTDHK